MRDKKLLVLHQNRFEFPPSRANNRKKAIQFHKITTTIYDGHAAYAHDIPSPSHPSCSGDTVPGMSTLFLDLVHPTSCAIFYGKRADA